MFQVYFSILSIKGHKSTNSEEEGYVCSNESHSKHFLGWCPVSQSSSSRWRRYGSKEWKPRVHLPKGQLLAMSDGAYSTLLSQKMPYAALSEK